MIVTTDMRHELWDVYSTRQTGGYLCQRHTSRKKLCKKSATRLCKYCKINNVYMCPEHMYMHMSKVHPNQLRSAKNAVLRKHGFI